jgi:hypothetical protein
MVKYGGKHKFKDTIRASLGTREDSVMTRALPVVSSMLKRVRVPLLQQPPVASESAFIRVAA